MSTNFYWLDDHPISSVRLDEGPAHDIVHVWNRGGKAGELTVASGDGAAVAALLERQGLDLAGKHIGKCSAAGLFCWACMVTLCRGGNSEIHYDRCGFYPRCPKCGAAPTGHACSFTWADRPEAVRERCESMAGTTLIVDEYNSEYTGHEFLDMLTRCPIEFTDSIGREFS